MISKFIKGLFANINKFNVLWFLIVVYTLFIIMANWFDARLIYLVGFSVTSGTIIYPLTFAINNIITEVYGYKFSRKCIWFGFFFNIMLVMYGYVITHIPPPVFAVRDAEMFDYIFSFSVIIVTASFVSYWFSEPLNSYINAKLKIITNARYMSCRFFLSTLCSTFVDSLIFTHIAFFSKYQYSHLWGIILSMWCMKIFIELISLFFSVPISKKLKIYEKVDRFDRSTNFTIFSSDANYDDQTNSYSKLRV